MVLERVARSRGVVALDGIDYGVVLSARRPLQWLQVDAEGDEPRDLIQTVTDQVGEERVPTSTGNRQVEFGVGPLRPVQTGRIAEDVSEIGVLPSAAHRVGIRELRRARRGCALEKAPHLKDVLDERHRDLRHEVASGRHALHVPS